MTKTGLDQTDREFRPDLPILRALEIRDNSCADSSIVSREDSLLPEGDINDRSILDWRDQCVFPRDVSPLLLARQRGKLELP